MNRYVLGALAVVGLVIVLILIISTGGHKSVPVPKSTSLPSYAVSSEVSVVVAGPIVAPQNYNEASITINQHNSTFILYQGYDGNVVTTKIFNNSYNSYKNFLYALYYAGYGKQIATTVPGNSGLCPNGNRYDFYLKNNGKTVSHTWATNCTGIPQTYGGNLGLTLNLFEAQIPQINIFIENANI